MPPLTDSVPDDNQSEFSILLNSLKRKCSGADLVASDKSGLVQSLKSKPNHGCPALTISSALDNTSH